jgi:hypothetical protein
MALRRITPTRCIVIGDAEQLNARDRTKGAGVRLGMHVSETQEADSHEITSGRGSIRTGWPVWLDSTAASAICIAASPSAALTRRGASWSSVSQKALISAVYGLSSKGLEGSGTSGTASFWR